MSGSGRTFPPEDYAYPDNRNRRIAELEARVRELEALVEVLSPEKQSPARPATPKRFRAQKTTTC